MSPWHAHSPHHIVSSRTVGRYLCSNFCAKIYIGESQLLEFLRIRVTHLFEDCETPFGVVTPYTDQVCDQRQSVLFNRRIVT